MAETWAISIETLGALEAWDAGEKERRMAEHRRHRELADAAHLWLVGKAVGNEYAQFLLRELEELEAYRKDD